MIYYGLLIWTIFVKGVISNKNISSEKILYLLITFVPLVLVGGLRGNAVGTDTQTYQNVFYRISGFTISQMPMIYETLGAWAVFEPGYFLLNKVVYYFTTNSQHMIFFANFLTLIGFAYWIYKNSSEIWLSVFLFISLPFYLETFNTIRQCFAVMLCCNAISLLQTGNKKHSIVILCIAITFHISSAVFIPFIMFDKYIKKFFWTFCVVVLLAGLIVFIIDFETIIMILNEVTGIEKYNSYVSMEKNSFSIGGIGKAIFVGAYIIISLVYQRNYCLGKNDQIYLIFLLMSSVFCVLQYKVAIFYRLINYFFIYLCIFVPSVVSRCKPCQKKILYIFTVVGSVIHLIFFLDQNTSFDYEVFKNNLF